METHIAYCGLNCYECLAYIATQKNDDNERSKVAEKWTKQYKHNFKTEDINCNGCLSEGLLVFGHCKVCEVRKCNKKKKIKNCGYCADYPCTNVGFIINNVPAAKARLDEIKNSLT